MLGVLVNVGTVLAGSLVGLFLKRGIPEKVTEALMIGIGLCTVFIGISGALQGENTLVLILSMAIGSVIGTLLDIDKQLNRLASYVEARFKQKDGQVTVAEGFVTASLLFCVGAMTIVGSLQAGLTGDCEMLFTKATLDLISSSESAFYWQIFLCWYFRGELSFWPDLWRPSLPTMPLRR